MSRPSPEILKGELEGLLADILRDRVERICARSERMRPVMDAAVQYVLNDGKRIRPQLLCWGYWGAGGGEGQAIKRASLSVELIHSYLLIHDDIIDRDERRRGQPTVHVACRDLVPGGSNEHLGISFAILAGDILSFCGYELLAEASFPADRRLEAISRMNRLLDEVTTGECLDVLSSYIGEAMTEEDIRTVAHYKTASYTVDGPLQIGGILAGASQEILDAYTAFAIPIGIAFQLRDDVLGIFGDSEKTGKSVSSDIQEGKRTLLIHAALRRASEEDASYLRHWLGNPALTPVECEEVRHVIRRSGALEETEAAIGELHGQALRSLEGAPLEEEARQFLARLAEMMVHRQK